MASGIFFYLSHTQKARYLSEVLQGILADAAAETADSKVMTYQIHAGTTAEQDVQFVRPVKRLLVLYGADVLPVTAFWRESRSRDRWSPLFG